MKEVENNAHQKVELILIGSKNDHEDKVISIEKARVSFSFFLNKKFSLIYIYF